MKNAMRYGLFSTGCALAWFSFAAGVVAVGPMIEATYAPPITDIHHSGISRDGSRVCWHTTFRKVRDTRPRAAEFWINYGGARDIIAVTLNGRQLTAPVMVEQNDAPVTIGPLCSELPRSIDGKVVADQIGSNVVIQGIVEYATHFAWSFIITYPPVLVPKLLPDGGDAPEMAPPASRPAIQPQRML